MVRLAISPPEGVIRTLMLVLQDWIRCWAISSKPAMSRKSALMSSGARTRVRNESRRPRRYERASLILTGNKSFLDWGEIFNDQVLATAILDRLLHHATTINIKGESYRLKEKRKAGLL